MICKICNPELSGDGYCGHHSTRGTAYVAPQENKDLVDFFQNPRVIRKAAERANKEQRKIMKESQENKDWREELKLEFCGGLRNKKYTIGEFDNHCVDWDRPSTFVLHPDKVKEWCADWWISRIETLLDKQEKEIREETSTSWYNP